MATIIIPMTIDDMYDYNCDGKGHKLKTDHILTLPGYRQLGLFAIPRHAEARQEFQGPMVSGPWAGTYGKCAVVTSDKNSGTKHETDRLRAEGKVHAVESGDFLVMDGVCYRVEVERRQYINLIAVADSHA